MKLSILLLYKKNFLLKNFRIISIFVNYKTFEFMNKNLY